MLHLSKKKNPDGSERKVLDQEVENVYTNVVKTIFYIPSRDDLWYNANATLNLQISNEDDPSTLCETY